MRRHQSDIDSNSEFFSSGYITESNYTTHEKEEPRIEVRSMSPFGYESRGSSGGE